MSFLKKILGGKSPQTTGRVRVCSQCGMPVTEHKSWCSILNGKKSQSAAAVETSD
jgi:hypothetical protein